MPDLSAQQKEFVQTGSTMAVVGYGDVPPGGNWNPVEGVQANTASGFQAQVYVNTTTNQLWVAVAGTNDAKDVAAWPGAQVGWSAAPDQFKDALTFGKAVENLVGPGGTYAGFSVNTSGHSWGELLSQLLTYTFGWNGVGFDGPGAGAVISSSGFTSEAASQGITPVGGTNFISCNTAGLINIGGFPLFGGGFIGSLGPDIAGTQSCTVEVSNSLASGLIALMITVASSNPLLGWLVTKIVEGVLLHDMKANINPAVQSGNFSVNGQPAGTSAPTPATYSDEFGNSLSTVTDGNGNVVTDTNGNIVYSAQLVAENGVKSSIQFTGGGQVLSISDPSLPSSGSVSNAITVTINPNPVAGQGQSSGSSGESSAVGNGGLLISSAGATVTMPASSVDQSSNGNLAETTKAGIVADVEPGRLKPLSESPATGTADHLEAPPAFGTDSGGISLNTGSQGGAQQVYVDPLILDLNGDGVKLTDYGSNPVLFDTDHDGGSLEQTGWVDANDGIVVRDLNGNGVIDGIHETLSEYYNGTVGTGGNPGSKPFANGLAALKSLDSNSDNVFTSADTSWNSLRVWVDANHDGKTDAGELKTFGELGITSISLAGTGQSGLVRDGNEVLATSSFVINGQSHEALAANFLANPNGHTFTTSGSGTVVNTQAGGGAAAVATYVSHSPTGETVDVAAKGVQNAYGSSGDDTLIGDANNNWLGGSEGSDTFSAGAGDDVLLIDAMDLQANIHAGAGVDIAQVVGDQGVTFNLAQAEVEIAQGGRGNDVLIGGGFYSVFVRGGDGDDIIVGGGANDALSGENGDDVVDGGAGNDIIRGHRGRDILLGGTGDDMADGGQDDDVISGGSGNDVLTGGQGDDEIDGGTGTDVAQFSGSFSEYRYTRTDQGLWVSDTVSGRDGTDLLKNVEKANFRDISLIDIPSNTATGLVSPMPVKDVLTKDKNGAALQRGAASYTFTQAQLLGNDVDFQGGALTITAFSDAQGGTVAINGNGDIVFTATAGFTGVMGFKYTIKDSQNNNAATVIDLGTGATAQMKAAVYLKTSDMPSDPLVTDQWYLTEASILPVWKDYTGKGVRVGQFEPGGDFAVDKEIFDYRHPDLQGNVDSVWLANPVAGQRAGEGSGDKFSTHATLVAGVIAADNNGEGAVGVAYDATIAGHWLGNGQTDYTGLLHFFRYDVANNSWTTQPSFAGNFDFNGFSTQALAILTAEHYGRSGLGTVIVTGAGNDRATGGNANNSNISNNRFAIEVGAINATTDLGTLQVGQAPFSNPGASILVSAPGSNIASTSRLIQNENGSVFGTDYQTAQGTSFATPIVSGIVALMLQANPELGYRDIQAILALTAKKVTDVNTTWQDNHATGWNGGAMHVSHDYGFGEVDARAAVRLAETWTRQSTIANEVSVSGFVNGGNFAIPDDGGTNYVIAPFNNMAAGVVVEHAEVTVNLTHQQAGDLIIKLISPTGTESILMNRPGKAPGSAASVRGDTTFAGSSTLSSYTFMSTRDWGELSGGNWTVQIIDAATGQTGTVGSVSLTLSGRTATSDDTFVYTDEYASVAGSSGRSTLADAGSGRDTINASAVTGATTINLATGSASIGGTGLTISSPGSIENVFTGDGNDAITGNSAANLLGAGRGSNTLTGGSGLDVFVVQRRTNASDTITDFDAAGGERILLANFDGKQFSDLGFTQQGANVSVSLGDGQTLTLNNTTVAALGTGHFEFQESFQAPRSYVDSGVTLGLPSGSTINGDANANVLVGTSQADTINGLGGDDEIHGGLGNDVLDGGAGSDKLYGEGGADTIYLDGDSTPTVGLSSGIGVIYNGGAAFGGSGTDTFVVRAAGDNLIADFELDDPNEKIDLRPIGVQSFQELSMSSRVAVSGVQMDTKVTYNGQAIVTLVGVMPGQLDASHFIFAGTPPTPPGAGSDTLIGDAGGTVLDGAGGADTMEGRTGDDTYIVDNAGDQVLEEAGGGFDTVRSSVSYTLPEEVENLVLTGSDNINGTGNAQRNRIVGNSGNNILDGGEGSDQLIGGAGNDTYVLDDGSDAVIEQEGEGTDTVQSSVSFTLSNNVENLTLTGSDAINATGNSLDNTLTGNANDNKLDGAAGADTMAGGAGNDTYLVDNAGDTVTEAVDQGIDTVVSSINNFTLGANVENLTFAIGVTSGTGNALDNGIVGNSGNNTLTALGGNDYLDGGAGNDTMVGGTGNDTYVVDSASDVVTEAAGEGTDTVLSSVTLTLAANVENLTLTGTSAINGAGNALANVLVGNSAANVLTGGAGDDTYYIGAGDSVVENASEGTDTVYSSVTFTLGANVENLTLTGAANINATGNGGGNVLTGNLGNNVLTGLGGADTLTGGQGNDSLIGGAGSDTYEFTGVFGHDTITDNDATAGNADLIRFGADIAPTYVVLSRSGQNLVLAVGSNDVTVQNWYASAADKVELVQFANGAIWDVNALRAATNLAPQLANAVADQNATEDLAFSFTVPTSTFSDADAVIGDTLSYSASLQSGAALPSWLSFNASTRTFSGTPSAPQLGAIDVRVTATDAVGATVSDVFRLTVSHLNHAPTVANPIADQNATEDSAFTFVVPANAFADVDAGDALTYTATRADGTALPAWLTFDAATRTFSGTPLNANVGTVDVKVTATDAVGASVSDVFGLNVANTNDAPTNIALSANTVAENSANATVGTLSTTDVDAGDTFTYSIQPGGDGAQFVISGNSLKVGSTALDYEAGAIRSVTVRTTDAGGAFVDKTFTVNVTNVN
ncbi:MAG: hypothetical protein QOD26_2888, partial [Betaproteobacteria bacterium]|nr:hypothetical protein [Betaproteobacteria bacterium]